MDRSAAGVLRRAAHVAGPFRLFSGLERDKFDNKTVTFEEHIKEEHNMWHYLCFIVLVKVKDSTEYTGPESYVAEMIKVSAGSGAGHMAENNLRCLPSPVVGEALDSACVCPLEWPSEAGDRRHRPHLKGGNTEAERLAHGHVAGWRLNEVCLMARPAPLLCLFLIMDVFGSFFLFFCLKSDLFSEKCV